MKKIILFAVIAVTAFSCNLKTENEQVGIKKLEEKSITAEERGFLDNLASLCGKSFRGKQVYMEEDRESWEDKEFVMHVTICEDDRVHIPFHLNDDHSRTWMFIVDDKGLRFRHDHRHEDGTPEELTLYGGYADGEGTPFRQHFPVDQYSIDLLDDHERMRQWNVVLAEDMSRFSYKLLYHGEVVFQADFDLTEPIKR